MSKKQSPQSSPPQLASEHEQVLRQHGLLDRLKGGDGKFDLSKLISLLEVLVPLLLKGAAPAPFLTQPEAVTLAARGLSVGGLDVFKVLELIKALLAAVEASGLLGQTTTVPSEAPV